MPALRDLRGAGARVAAAASIPYGYTLTIWGGGAAAPAVEWIVALGIAGIVGLDGGRWKAYEWTSPGQARDKPGTSPGQARDKPAPPSWDALDPSSSHELCSCNSLPSLSCPVLSSQRGPR